MTKNFIDLFCGAGGLSLGFKRAGFKCVGAIDISKACINTHKLNFPDCVSINKDNLKSYKMALASDPISAFGGIVSCNFKINRTIATELNKIFLEVIIANGFNKDALKILKKKKKCKNY